MRGIVRKDSLDENLKAVRRKLDSLGLSVSAVILFAVLAIIGLVALFAPILAPYDPNDQNLTARLEPPSLDHPLGTDHLGRDVLSRLLMGSRFSLAITTVAVLISGVFGTLVGAIAGRVGGATDEAAMRVVDVVLVFPELVVAFALASMLEQGFGTIVLAVTIFAWTPYARLARAVTLEVNTREFMEAAVALGSTPSFILRRHILPNIMGPILAMGFLRFGQLLITIAGLSYLGVGAQPPTPDWGAMLWEAQPYMRRVPSLTLIPGAAIFITALSVTLFGQRMMLRTQLRTRA
ncbi:MAG: ABC transporter permease [Dehalococcoidia bacterium]|nr:ABC transporter permease [Dehalococcoidia bacterium]